MNDPRRPATLKIPRGEARRRELLVEAARVFLRDGLDGTSMDLIALEAGTSKATLYRHFHDKHGLLVAVVEFLCSDFLSDIDLAPAPELDLRSGLRRILMQLVHVLAKPLHPQFFRLIVSGTPRDPGIGQTWHDHGPILWHRRLREVFTARQAAGELPAGRDVTDCPEILFDAVFTRMIIHTAIVGPEVDADRDPALYVDRLLDSVLAGLGMDCSSRRACL